jgi:uncharacterized protein with FMN-binding domain
MSTRTSRRRAAGLAGLLAAVALPVAVKAATAPASRPVALGPGRSAPPNPAAGTTPRTGSGQSGTGATRTVAGAVEDTPYGPVQVQVALAGSRIMDVSPVQLPNDNGRSREINDYAAPLLRQEVLDAQSAQVDTISGASYTSDGYARSVQSALDAAGHGG